MPLYHLALQHKKPTQIVWAYLPQNPFAPEEKRVPALPVYAVPVSPVAGSGPATLFLIPCIVRTGLAGVICIPHSPAVFGGIYTRAPIRG